MLKQNPNFIITITLLSIFVIVIITSASFAHGEESSNEGKIRLWITGYNKNISISVDLYNSSFNKIKTIKATSPIIEFTNLIIGNQYFLILNNQSNTYSIEVNLDIPYKELTFNINNEIDSDSKIIIDFDHILIELEENRIHVSELIEFKNYGKQEGSFIRVYVQNNYSDLESDKCCINIGGNGNHSLFSPILIETNKTRLIEFKYTVEFNSREYNFSKIAPYNTTSLIFLVDNNNTKVETSKDIFYRNSQEINGKIFEQYSASGILDNEQISLNIIRIEEDIFENIWTFLEDFSYEIFKTFSIYYLWLILLVTTFILVSIIGYNYQVSTRIESALEVY